MSDVIITVQCPHVGFDEDGEEVICEAEIEVQCEYIPSDIYGADADGNRGMRIPAYLDPGYPPDECPECKTKYDSDELANLREQIKQACSDYRPEPPEYDPY